MAQRREYKKGGRKRPEVFFGLDGGDGFANKLSGISGVLVSLPGRRKKIEGLAVLFWCVFELQIGDLSCVIGFGKWDLFHEK